MTKTDQIVIVDTNILDYGTKKDLSGEVSRLLPTIESEGYKLAISAYELFEAYRGMRKDRVPVMKQLVDPFTPLKVEIDTFKIAAALYTCYKSHEATKSKNGNGDKPRKDDDGDIVIAATAFHYNALVLTSNGNDFPRPFFSEVGKPYILKRATNKAQIRVHLLQPEIAVFNEVARDCLI